MSHRIYEMSVASVYQHYVTKVEKKGRTLDELNQVIIWLTGYSDDALEEHLEKLTNFRLFFDQAPLINPNARLITGKICGVQIEEIEDDLMRYIRYMDKLVDELAKGRPMEKILRTSH